MGKRNDYIRERNPNAYFMMTSERSKREKSQKMEEGERNVNVIFSLFPAKNYESIRK